MRTGMGVNCTKLHYQQKNPQNPYGDSGFFACCTFNSTGQVQIHMGQCCYVALPVVFLFRFGVPLLEINCTFNQGLR